MVDPWLGIRDVVEDIDWRGVIGAAVRGNKPLAIWIAVSSAFDAGPVADGTLPPHMRGPTPQDSPPVQGPKDEAFNPVLFPEPFGPTPPPIRRGPKLPKLPPPMFPPDAPKPSPDTPETERERALVFGYRRPLSKANWGELNAFPLVKADVTTFYTTQATGKQYLEEAIAESFANFAAWLGLTNGNFKRGEALKLKSDISLGDVTNQGMLFLPEYWHNLGGRWRWIAGLKPLHFLYADMFSTSRNAQEMEETWSHGVVYQSVTITETHQDLLYQFTTPPPEGLGGGIAMNEVLEPFFRNFEEYKDDGHIAFAFENSNIGEVLKGVGYEQEATLVPESLIDFSDDDLLKVRYWQVKALEEELETVKNPKTRKALEKEIAKIKAQPLRRYREINSLAERINWAVISIHELLGDFPLKIRWKNSDIIQIGNDPSTETDDSGTNMLQTVKWEGDDAKVVSYHNLAAMLRELLVESQFNFGLNQRILQQGTANLTEAALARQMVIKNWHLLDVIRDWIGIATKQEKKKVQFSYDPRKPENFDDYLNPSEIEIPVEEIDLKTEEIPFSTVLGYLTQAAAITHAVHTVSLDDKDQWKKYIMGKLGNFVEARDRRPEGEQSEEEPKDDWDDFLESVEQGFVGSAVLNPWGKPYENRPRVRDITSDKLK